MGEVGRTRMIAKKPTDRKQNLRGEMLLAKPLQVCEILFNRTSCSYFEPVKGAGAPFTAIQDQVFLCRIDQRINRSD